MWCCASAWLLSLTFFTQLVVVVVCDGGARNLVAPVAIRTQALLNHFVRQLQLLFYFFFFVPSRFFFLCASEDLEFQLSQETDDSMMETSRLRLVNFCLIQPSHTNSTLSLLPLPALLHLSYLLLVLFGTGLFIFFFLVLLLFLFTIAFD